MNNTNQKQYLVIKNVGTDTYLRHYLEKICEENHVQIITEYINNNWFEEPKPSLYAEFNAKPMFDALLCSYDNNKLLYVKYLFDKYDRLGMSIDKAIMDVQNSKKEEEKLIKETEDQIDSLSYSFYCPQLYGTAEKTEQVLKSWYGVDWNLMNNSVKIYNLEPEKISVKDKIKNWIDKYKLEIFIVTGIVLTIIFNVVK